MSNKYYYPLTNCYSQEHCDAFTREFLLQSMISSKLNKGNRDGDLIKELMELLVFKQELATSPADEVLTRIPGLLETTIALKGFPQITTITSKVVPDTEQLKAHAINRIDSLSDEFTADDPINFVKTGILTEQQVVTLTYLMTAVDLINEVLIEVIFSREDVIAKN